MPRKNENQIQITCPNCKKVFLMNKYNVKGRGNNLCRECAKTKKFDYLIGTKVNRVEVIGYGSDIERKDGTKVKTFTCKCDCGKVFTSYATVIKSGHTKSCGCFKTDLRRGAWSGSNNPQFANLSEEERASADNIRKLPEYEKWRQDVISRDFGECQKCGSDLFIEVHHIRSYKQNPGLAVNIDNGIVLCSTCHREYHSFNGGTRKEATIESFNGWFRRK